MNAAFSEERVLALSDAVGRIALFAVVWVLVGVPVAACISATQLLITVIFVLPMMAKTAAVLGSIQGLWLQLAGRSSRAKSGDMALLGVISGGVLGLLGFPPVFFKTEIVVEDLPIRAFIILVASAVLGGIAAGAFAVAAVPIPVRAMPSTLSRSAVSGSLILGLLLMVEYFVFWEGTAERLPILPVSREAINALTAGNARGSSWAGCYQYDGHTPLRRGGQNGLLHIKQANGELQVTFGDSQSPVLSGGVDRNGQFRFGAERVSGEGIARDLWEGRFYSASLDFTHRSTLVSRMNVVTNERLTGTGRRAACPDRPAGENQD